MFTIRSSTKGCKDIATSTTRAKNGKQAALPEDLFGVRSTEYLKSSVRKLWTVLPDCIDLLLIEQPATAPLWRRKSYGPSGSELKFRHSLHQSQLPWLRHPSPRICHRKNRLQLFSLSSIYEFSFPIQLSSVPDISLSLIALWITV